MFLTAAEAPVYRIAKIYTNWEYSVDFSMYT